MTPTRRIPFMKMDGAGNDFVFINRAYTNVSITKNLAQKLLDRHFGIGGDQLLVYRPGTSLSPPQLDFYNADGSSAEMCGNGTRAVAFYLREFEGIKKNLSIKTKSRLVPVNLAGTEIEVNMGRPAHEIDRTLKVGKQKFKIHAVSMGNPHCVIYVPNVQKFPVQLWGPQIENHSFFPKRANVEFVQVLNRSNVRVRVWERGAGETLACGSGACAVTVAGNRINKTGRKINMFFPGGKLGGRISDGGEVFLKGPAKVSYSGTFLL